jgi:hypothetical protein
VILECGLAGFGVGLGLEGVAVGLDGVAVGAITVGLGVFVYAMVGVGVFVGGLPPASTGEVMTAITIHSPMVIITTGNIRFRFI